MDYEIAWQGTASLAESPTWDHVEKKLYWLDIVEKKLNILDVQAKKNVEFQMPALIGSVVRGKIGSALATIDRSLMSIDLNNGKIETIAELVPKTRPDMRVNDGKCDAKGRFWIGVATEDKNKRGKLYKYDIDHSITEMDDDIIFSNGMGWNPAHTIFYYVDSERRCVFNYDYDLISGTITSRKIFIQFEQDAAFKPDGLTVDKTGNVWLACFNGAKILCINSNGLIVKDYKLPVQRPTSCMFGGNDLKTLFITSCAKDVNETTKLPFPAGSIFSIETDCVGIPEYFYAG
jgi:sugar lactone lactonase YvrE